MMKTLCFTLGLLLLSACCCNAMPQAVQHRTAPECCFKFYTERIPLKRVSTITKTNSACPNKAFIVRTIKGRQFCYKESFQWAQNIYHQLHYTEGSGQQL